MSKSRLIGAAPVISIRPVIDARRGTLDVRGSLEVQTMNQRRIIVLVQLMVHCINECEHTIVVYTNVKVLITNAAVVVRDADAFNLK